MKNKKEFFGVSFSVLISVFLVILGVYATTTISNDINIGDDLVITGNNIDFANGASISNSADAENLVLTETLIILSGKASVSGDFNIQGNDLTFGNGAAITNTDADTLTLTELLFDLNGSLDVSNDLIVGTGPLQVGHTASVAYSRFGTGTTGHSTLVSASSDVLISDNLEVDGTALFDGVASVSDANGLMIGGGVKLFGGTASPAGATLNCVKGSWYFRAGQTASASLYYCATTNEWDDISGF